MYMARVALILGSATVAVLLFGPFSGIEARFFLTDKEAHFLAFFTLTSLTLMAFPFLRRDELIGLLILFAGGTEIVQDLVGRDGNVADWLADSAGCVMFSLAVAIDRVRSQARLGRSGHMGAVQENRRGRARHHPKPEQAPRPTVTSPSNAR
jgi:hypothetical protein